MVDNLLHPEGVDRIAGFNAWFGNARQTLFGLQHGGASETATS